MCGNACVHNMSTIAIVLQCSFEPLKHNVKDIGKLNRITLSYFLDTFYVDILLMWISIHFKVPKIINNNSLVITDEKPMSNKKW